jgi:hypothetical protein
MQMYVLQLNAAMNWTDVYDTSLKIKARDEYDAD